MKNYEDYKLLEGEFGEQVNLIDITKKIILNTYGGDISLGFAAYDLLKPIEDSEAGVVGVCASSGTIALLGASNRWGTKNSKFAIHNPWGQPKGDAAKLQQVATALKAEEEKLINLYIQELNIEEGEIRQIMNNAELFDAEEALRIGLIKEIKEDQLSTIEGKDAKEVFFNLKNSEMNKQELQAEMKTGFDGIFDRLKNLLPTKFKNILLKDANGVELDFDVETAEEIIEGTTVTADGTPASGTFVMSEGITIIAESGKVTKVEVPVDEMAVVTAENEALKAEIETLKGSVDSKDEEIKNLASGVKETKVEIEKLQNVFSEKIKNFASPGSTDEEDKSKPKTRSAFKKSE